MGETRMKMEAVTKATKKVKRGLKNYDMDLVEEGLEILEELVQNDDLRDELLTCIDGEGFIERLLKEFERLTFIGRRAALLLVRCAMEDDRVVLNQLVDFGLTTGLYWAVDDPCLCDMLFILCRTVDEGVLPLTELTEGFLNTVRTALMRVRNCPEAIFAAQTMLAMVLCDEDNGKTWKPLLEATRDCFESSVASVEALAESLRDAAATVHRMEALPDGKWRVAFAQRLRRPGKRTYNADYFEFLQQLLQHTVQRGIGRKLMLSLELDHWLCYMALFNARDKLRRLAIGTILRLAPSLSSSDAGSQCGRGADAAVGNRHLRVGEHLPQRQEVGLIKIVRASEAATDEVFTTAVHATPETVAAWIQEGKQTRLGRVSLLGVLLGRCLHHEEEEAPKDIVLRALCGKAVVAVYLRMSDAALERYLGTVTNVIEQISVDREKEYDADALCATLGRNGDQRKTLKRIVKSLRAADDEAEKLLERVASLGGTSEPSSVALAAS